MGTGHPSVVWGGAGILGYTDTFPDDGIIDLRTVTSLIPMWPHHILFGSLAQANPNGTIRTKITILSWWVRLIISGCWGLIIAENCDCYLILFRTYTKHGPKHGNLVSLAAVFWGSVAWHPKNGCEGDEKTIAIARFLQGRSSIVISEANGKSSTFTLK